MLVQLSLLLTTLLLNTSISSLEHLTNMMPVIAKPYVTVMLVGPICTYWGVANTLGGRQNWCRIGNALAAYYSIDILSPSLIYCSNVSVLSIVLISLSCVNAVDYYLCDIYDNTSALFSYNDIMNDVVSLSLIIT